MLALALVLSLAPSPRGSVEPWIEELLAGHRALEQDHLHAARDAFLATLAARPNLGSAAWQLAGIEARLGRLDEAWAWLERAVEWGERDPAMLEWDPDLARLRRDAERMRGVADRMTRTERPASLAPASFLVPWAMRAEVSTQPFWVSGGQIIDAVTGRPVDVLASENELGLRRTIRADGLVVSTVSGAAAPESRVGMRLRLVDVRTGRRAEAALAHANGRDVAFTTDPDLLVTYSRWKAGDLPTAIREGRAEQPDWAATVWTLDPFEPTTKSLEEVQLLPTPTTTTVEFPDRELVRRLTLAAARAVRPGGNEHWLGRADGVVQVLDIESGRPTRQLPLGGRVSSIAFAPDGERAAVLLASGRVVLVAAETMEVLRDHSVPVDPDRILNRTGRFEPTPIEFAPDGASLIVADGYERTHLLDGRTLEHRFEAQAPESEPRFFHGTWAWHPDSDAIAIAQTNTILRLDPHSGDPLAPPIRIEGNVAALAYAPDGATLWVADETPFQFDPPATSRVRVFDGQDGRQLRELSLGRFGEFGTYSVDDFAFDEGLAVVVPNKYSDLVALQGDAVELGSGPEATSTDLAWSTPWNWCDCFGNVHFADRFLYVTNEEHKQVLDRETGSLFLDLSMFDSGRLSPVAGSRALLAGDGRSELREVPTGELVYRRFDLPGGEWLLRSRSGHVDGSAFAVTHLPFVTGDGLTPFETLAPALLDPKRVRASIEGVAVVPMAMQEPFR